MTAHELKRIRVDWDELEEAFSDAASEHRYYLDRETGAVHFFSTYLENEDEEEDERAMTSEGRYVLVPSRDRRDKKVKEFSHGSLDARIRAWLSEVRVEPL